MPARIECLIVGRNFNGTWTRGLHVNRMQFLRGDFSGRRAPVRPPWALPDQRFTEACTRCKACVSACPNGILIQGRGGFPEVDFSRGECEFCGACALVCTPGALVPPANTAPWAIKVSIDASCLTRHGVVCRTCGEQCETGAIRFHIGARGVATPTLDAAQCTGCGACIAPCPSAAIRVCRAADEHPALQEAITA